MVLTIELPDDLIQHADPPREALERLTVECYRSQALSPRQCRELLGLTRLDFEGFLKSHNVEEGAYNFDDLEHDIAFVRGFESPHRKSA